MALLCMGGVFALLCMKSRRLIPYYAVAGVPAMAMGAQFVFAVSAAKNAWLQKSAFLFAVLAGGTVTAMAWQEERTMTVAIAAPGGLRTLNASFPVYCADILMKAPTKGNLFNDYNHGGYLHWAASPNWKVFIDGRNDLYGEQFTLLYDAIASGTDRPLQRLDEYKVNAALVSYEMCLASPNIAMQLGASSQWGVAGFDDAAILFVRKAAFDKEWLERNELRLVQPWQLYEAQASELAKNGQLAGYISELQKLTAGGRCRIAEHMLAEALADSGQKREALTVLDRAEQYFGVDGRSQQLRSKMR